MSPATDVFNLHVVGLRNLDSAVIRVFLHLLEKNPSTLHRWVMHPQEPAHLVLTHPHECQAGAITRKGLPLAWVLARHEPAPQDGRPVLRRPLQLEDFITLLKHSTAEAVIDNPSPNHPTATRSTTGTFVPAEAHTSRHPPEDLSTWAVVLKLHRWPPELVLNANPSFRRLAVFLLNQPITPRELAQRSGVPWNACAAFLGAMHHLNALEIRPVPRQAALLAPATQPGTPGNALLNILGRMRQRLGL
jgi:hypothetical protein